MQTNQSGKDNTRSLQKALALEYAKQYCAQRGLSNEKLKAQRLEFINGAAIFAQPSGITPNGLLNDIATQPFPTLVIKLIDGKLTFETTEHTDKYLK